MTKLPKKNIPSISLSLKIFWIYKRMSHACTYCPHFCGVRRDMGDVGFCNTSYDNSVANICIHRGEEPVISGNSGICNVFFFHCNLQCIYCQNFQISSSDVPLISQTIDTDVQQIKKILDTGITHLGFVSPSHCIEQMINIIELLGMQGYKPKIVYNTNAYDTVETLRKIAPLVDIYLPDFKYSDNNIGLEFSGVSDYAEVALNAIKEMYFQKGALLHTDLNDKAESGLIIRHLVLPGYVENSINVLRNIAESISTRVHVSLMAQYYPTEKVKNHSNLGRKLRQSEYQQVLEEFDRLGFTKGWKQQLGSAEHYLPDFNLEDPFE